MKIVYCKIICEFVMYINLPNSTIHINPPTYSRRALIKLNLFLVYVENERQKEKSVLDNIQTATNNRDSVSMLSVLYIY